MKNILFNLCLLTFIALESTAQYDLDWINPSGVYNKSAVMSTMDNGNNLVVTGYLQTENIYTHKYDITGNLLWEKIDSSGIQSKYEKPIWISCDEDDNVFVVGKRYSISSGWEYPDAIVAIKYSPDGAFLWKQEIAVTVPVGSPHPAFNLRCETDPNGNLYIGTVAALPQGFVLIKINPQGIVQYVNNSTLNSPIGFWSMRLKDDKVIMAAGGSIMAPIMVWDTAGTIVWSIAVPGRGAKDVEMDDEGNVFMISNLNNQVSGSSGEDMSIYKFDQDGVQLWKKDFDFSGEDYSSKFVLKNGRLSIIGYGTTNQSLYFDWKILQTDTNGELLWMNTYNETSFNDEEPYFITSKPDGEVIVTGKGGPSPDPNNPSYLQMVILQYNNAGMLVWSDTPNVYGGWGLSCMLASDNSLYAISSANMTTYHYIPSQATGMNEQNNFNPVTIWPNPFTDKISVSLNTSEGSAAAFLYDTKGQLLQKFNLEGKENTIDLSGLNRGMYVCRIETAQTTRSIKIIKE